MKTDVEEPEMYLPLMGFITYMVLLSLHMALYDEFHPDVFGIGIILNRIPNSRFLSGVPSPFETNTQTPQSHRKKRDHDVVCYGARCPGDRSVEAGVLRRWLEQFGVVACDCLRGLQIRAAGIPHALPYTKFYKIRLLLA